MKYGAPGERSMEKLRINVLSIHETAVGCIVGSRVILSSTGTTGSLKRSIADLALLDSAPSSIGGDISPAAIPRKSGKGPHPSSSAGRIRQQNFRGKKIIKPSDNGSMYNR